MSNTNPPGVPQGSRRDRLRQDQQKATQEARVRNIVTFSVLGVALLAIVGVLVWVVMSAARPATVAGTTGEAGSETEFALLVGQSSAPVTVDIFQDFMCPFCGQFERANRDDLAAMVDAGTAQLRIHPMAFLDDASQGTQFSTRAANALVTVAKAEPDKVLAFNAALYDSQPEENTAGLTDAQIAELARGAGVSNETVATFASLANKSFVASATTKSFASGVKGTPTIKINGETFTGDLYTAGALKDAVAKAAAK